MYCLTAKISAPSIVITEKNFYQNFKHHKKPNNLEYCLKHNIEYIDFTENIEPIRGN